MITLRPRSARYMAFIALVSAVVITMGCARINERLKKQEQAPQLDPCKLLTQSDAERILDRKVLQREDVTPGEIRCTYDDVTDPGGFNVAFFIVQDPTPEASREMFEFYTLRAEARFPFVTETIKGIGDQAYWEYLTGIPNNWKTIHVRKGRTRFFINAHTGTGNKPQFNEVKAIAKRLADQF
jgi:hypothetical protein